MTAFSKNRKKTKTENLALSTKDGTEVYLSPQKLGQWMALVAPTKNLSLYGFKSPEDIIIFLKSPAGQTVKKIIGEQKLAEMALKDYQIQQRTKEETQKFRRFAALLLALSYKEKAYAKEQNEIILEQIRKTLQEHKTASGEKSINHLPEMLNLYLTSLHEIDSMWEEKNQQLIAIEGELIALDHHESAMIERYQIFDTHQRHADDFLKEAMHADLKPEEMTNALEQRMSYLKKEMDKTEISPSKQKQLQAQLENIANTLKEQKDNKIKINNENRIIYIENKMNQLEEKINKKLERISSFLQEKKDEEAKKLTTEIQGLYMQIDNMEDAIDVLRGDTLMYKEDGEKATSFADAHFLLSKEQKIVKDNGKYYLLGANQSFDTMNEEERAKAQQSYKHARPDIASLKNLIQYNKGQETTLHEQKKNEVLGRKADIQNQMTFLENQRNALQAASARINTALQGQVNAPVTATPTATIPMATPISTSVPASKSSTASTKPTPKPAVLTQELAKLQPMPTKRNIAHFNETLKNASMPEAQRNELLGKIPVGRPIPEQTMRNLSSALDRFTVSLQFNKKTQAKKTQEEQAMQARQATQKAEEKQQAQRKAAQNEQVLHQQEALVAKQETQHENQEKKSHRTPLSTIPKPPGEV